MLATYGLWSLIFACICAGLQCLVPFYGYLRKNIYALAFANVAALLQCIFVALAFGLLMTAFVNNDFSLAYVALNSHESLPLMYRYTALWGAHEGSILLWIMILNLWTLGFYFYSICKKNSKSSEKLANNVNKQIWHDLRALTIAILGLINFGFLIFLIFTSNPFLRATGHPLGSDLNPLLQDPGFIIHPPMLYAGYVGYAITFAITQSALLLRAPPRIWLAALRTFALAAWCFLTFGILLGSWWSYRVLGWGGFWFWDPVENASLLPWLAGTALLHILVLADKRNIALLWMVMLASFCFLLSVLGTLLVRSGILISAHTFASDPSRGLFLLLMLASIALLAFVIYFFVPNDYLTSPKKLKLWSRETTLIFNSGLLIIAMLTILLGTIYPLIIDSLHLQAISVGAPYFNKVLFPLVCILLMAMGIAPFLGWQQQQQKFLYLFLLGNAALSLLISSILVWLLYQQLEFATIFCVALALWIIFTLAKTKKTLPAMSIAHFGFAIFILGIALSALLNQEKEVRSKPGEQIKLNQYYFNFKSVQRADGANYRGLQADFVVFKNNHYLTLLQPEKRIYIVRDIVMSKVAIHPGIFRDLYIALGEPLEGEYWSVRIYYKPFVRFIWFGGLLMMLGGFIAIVQRQRQTTTPYV